jgi:hypothetical protein
MMNAQGTTEECLEHLDMLYDYFNEMQVDDDLDYLSDHMNERIQEAVQKSSADRGCFEQWVNRLSRDATGAVPLNRLGEVVLHICRRHLQQRAQRRAHEMEEAAVRYMEVERRELLAQSCVLKPASGPPSRGASSGACSPEPSEPLLDATGPQAGKSNVTCLGERLERWYSPSIARLL